MNVRKLELQFLKIKMYKISKKLNINLKTGSTDYKNATGFLKDVLVKAVNNDLTFSLLNIKCILVEYTK